MPDSTKKPAAEDVRAVPSLACRVGGPDGKPETEQNHPAKGAVPDGSEVDPTEALKRGLEATRLPADLKEQILAELPPPEERQRLFRELKEKGGLSAEQFFASLGLEVEPQP